MEKIEASSVREFINYVGLKDRHAQKLVVDQIFNGEWKQLFPSSTTLISIEQSIEEPVALLLKKKKLSVETLTSDNLSEEAAELLASVKSVAK